MIRKDQDIDELFIESDKVFVGDDVDQELEMPVIDINMTEINDESKHTATLITERLAGYYFSQEYIDEHPYIPTKIMLVMNNVRRLLKVLIVNEKAQDSLLMGISYNAGKGSLYTSLTALQNSMLNTQTQLNTFVKELEDIFAKMQAECDKTFKEKELEKNQDGTITVRGARELLKEIDEMQKAGKLKSNIVIETAEEIDKNITMDDLIQKNT